MSAHDLYSENRLIAACVIGVLLCLGLAELVGWASAHGLQAWYVALNKPTFNPPSWVFAPVWTVLYVLIGIAGGILWVCRRSMPWPFVFYLIQLVCNFAWSFLFFGWHQIGWAFVDSVLMLASTFLVILLSYPQNKYVAFLLMPYFVWGIYASVLNAALWYLNP